MTRTLTLTCRNRRVLTRVINVSPLGHLIEKFVQRGHCDQHADNEWFRAEGIEHH